MKNRSAFVGFRDYHIRASRYYTRLFMRLGLSLPQYTLLSQLYHFGALPMTEASRKLMISKPALTQLVSRLEKEGCLKRSPHPRDRRSCLIEIAAKGRSKIREAQEAMLELTLVTLKGFPAKEREVIQRFYSSLISQIEARCKTTCYEDKKS